jgi:hypothetical protein
MDRQTKQIVAEAEQRAVAQVVERYFQAIHQGDTAGLATVFHPSATLIGWDEGALRHVTLERWFRFVKSIPSPASEGAECDGKILAIDVSGTAAMVKVGETYRAFYYVDYLSLVKVGDGWRIVSKCYHQARQGARWHED